MSEPRFTTIPAPFVLPLLALLIVIGTTLRWPGIDRPLGSDELTIVSVASLMWLDVFSYLPGDHVLYTFCARLVHSLFGGEVALRMPALLAGLAGIPVIFWFGRRLTGAPTIGLLASLLLMGHHLHIILSGQARGYTLLTLLGMCYAATVWIALTRTLAAASEPRDAAGRRAPVDAWPWITVAIVGSLTILTMPVAILLIGAGTIGALLLIRRVRGGAGTVALLPLLLATIAIFLHAGLVYVPQLEGLRAYAQQSGQPLTFLGFAGFVSHVWGTIGPPRLGWLMHLFALWGLITLEGARRAVGLFLGALLGLPMVLNLALGTQLEAGSYIFLVPFSLIAIAAGAESLRLLILRQMRDVSWGRWAAALPTLLVLASFYSEVTASW